MLEVDEIQGNVLYAYGPRYRYARYILLRIIEPDVARKTLTSLIAEVTFGQRPKQNGTRGDAPHINIAFTYAGLKALGVDEATLGGFPKEFREPEFKKPQATVRNDGHDTPPWRFGKGNDAHVLLVVHATTDVGRGSFRTSFLPGLKPVVDPLDAALLEKDHESEGETHGNDEAGSETHGNDEAQSEIDPPDGDGCNTSFDREHFGFADGCSQPAIDGVHDDPVGGGIYARRPFGWWRGLRWLELLTEDLGIRQVPRRWRGIRAGEFVLGYENEDGTLPTGPPAPLGPNGTFMVYRQLHQDVRVFKDFVTEHAARLEVRRVEEAERRKRDQDTDPIAAKLDANALVRAKIVGRWPDGTPLALSPDSQDTLIAKNARRANNFLYDEDRDGYRADPEGLRCPLGAHVRRTNPRDALPGGAERTMRHRIIRRGMPYGERHDAKVDGSERHDRGLAFVCFSASIRNGFEFIQDQWCDGGNAFGLGEERDLLLQEKTAQASLTGMVIPGHDGTSIILDAPKEPFVTVRGCEYLFLPSRRACTWLMKPDR